MDEGTEHQPAQCYSPWNRQGLFASARKVPCNRYNNYCNNDMWSENFKCAMFIGNIVR